MIPVSEIKINETSVMGFGRRSREAPVAFLLQGNVKEIQLVPPEESVAFLLVEGRNEEGQSQTGWIRSDEGQLLNGGRWLPAVRAFSAITQMDRSQKTKYREIFELFGLPPRQWTQEPFYIENLG
jgi:hypothetical protein